MSEARCPGCGEVHSGEGHHPRIEIKVTNADGEVVFETWQDAAASWSNVFLTFGRKEQDVFGQEIGAACWDVPLDMPVDLRAAVDRREDNRKPLLLDGTDGKAVLGWCSAGVDRVIAAQQKGERFYSRAEILSLLAVAWRFAAYPEQKTPEEDAEVQLRQYDDDSAVWEATRGWLP